MNTFKKICLLFVLSAIPFLSGACLGGFSLWLLFWRGPLILRPSPSRPPAPTMPRQPQRQTPWPVARRKRIAVRRARPVAQGIAAAARQTAARAKSIAATNAAKRGTASAFPVHAAPVNAALAPWPSSD